MDDTAAAEPFDQWAQVLRTVVEGNALSADLAERAIAAILDGQASDAQIGGLLIGLQAKGETAEEVLGMRRAMLEASVRLDLPPGTIDIVGVGGSPRRRIAAFNVSTIACVVASAAGATVCKHGNRKASSTSGSFDLLEALGMQIEMAPDRVEQGVRELGLGYAFARAHHPAMRHVGPTRSQLGVPTIFNMLGPICHPGRVRRQVLGVPGARRAAQAADVVAGTDAECVWVVHGHGDLDELTTSGPASVIEIKAGERRSFVVDPADFGFAPVTETDIRGGDAEVNAGITHALLAGEASPNRDIVVLNAGAGLVVADLATDLAEGIALAAAAIDDGRAAAKLQAFVEFTNA